ncbi:MAG: thioredoxin-disulfide reductase [Erysipelotrichaceae bacterium]|nr:thioredoxin-disulfide reductase [Erysipelotrichaceae bacterium]
MERQYDLIIIGAGPAGMSAAIYASRAGLKTAMLEMGAPGGKLLKTAEISNWPGIKETEGAKLAYDMFEHSTIFGAEYVYGNVVKVEDGEWKKVICDDGNVYEAKAVIVATGTQERMLNIPGEQENVGRGVSYCAVCDGAFFKDQEICVIGGGNSALEEAKYLTQFASKVNIIIRRDVFRADVIVQEGIKNNEKINVITNSVPVEIKDDGKKVSALCIKNVKTDEISEIATNAIFPYIGLDPATSFLSGLDVLDDYGYMVVDDNCETKVKGIYGAGDVVAKKLRQVVTATSDGAIAAQHAFHRIKQL